MYTYKMLIVLSDDKNMTMNIHLVNHLADHVHNWGPLVSYMCFVLESMNGHVKLSWHQGYDETSKALYFLTPKNLAHELQLTAKFNIKKSMHIKLSPRTYHS